MLKYQGYRLRIYPTTEQAERLHRWEDALRSLWNCALEQRFIYHQRHANQPSAFDQIKQLSELRSYAPWISDVPSTVCSQLLVYLDMACQMYFSKLSKIPRWKKKNGEAVSITTAHYQRFKINKNGVTFTKIGDLEGVLHRPIVGKPKRCTISRDVDQWFVSILCEQEVPDPTPRTTPVIGIDRGITNLVADSNGSVVPNPKHAEKMQRQLAHAQRVVSRRVKGSANREKAKLRVAKIYRKIRRRRVHTLHVLSAWYAKTFGVVVVEDLKVAGLIKGALSKQINDASWSAFVEMLHYKTKAVGGCVELIRAAYSSQTCARCQNVDKASRQGERYNCVKCGNAAHADVHAAKVLKQRYENSRRSDGGAVRGGTGAPSRPAKRKTYTAKRIAKKQARTPIGL